VIERDQRGDPEKAIRDVVGFSRDTRATPADLDQLLNGAPIEPPAPVSAGGRPAKCKRHPGYAPSWANGLQGAPACTRCGTPKNDAASRRGRASIARSKREERGLAKHYAGKRTGHLGGPDDVQTGLLNIQSKAGSTWWSARYAAELDKLPRTGGRVPALIVSNGQPGQLVRRFVVMDERDYRALYGDLILDGVAPRAEDMAR
jgi:hypothetical protein